MKRSFSLPLLLCLLLTGACSGAEVPVSAERETRTPAALVAHASDDVGFGQLVFLGQPGKQQLQELIESAQDAADEEDAYPWNGDTDLALFEATNPEDYLFLTGSFYCGPGEYEFSVTPGLITMYHIDSGTSCEAPAPVSSIFRIERDLVGDTFTVQMANETGNETATYDVIDWAIQST